jgi:hypothetical protein
MFSQSQFDETLPPCNHSELSEEHTITTQTRKYNDKLLRTLMEQNVRI